MRHASIRERVAKGDKTEPFVQARLVDLAVR